MRDCLLSTVFDDVAMAVPAAVRTRRAARALLLALGAPVLLFAGPSVHAQLMLGHMGHGSMGGCHISKNGHELHFTAYRAETKINPGVRLEGYCDVIPAPGMLQMTVDLMDEKARETPTAARLVRVSTGSTAGHTRLLDLPPRTYGSGMITLEYNAEQPGDFELQIAFGSNAAATDIVAIPFAVAKGHGGLAGFWYVPIGTVLAFLAAGASFYLRRRRRGAVAAVQGGSAAS